MSTPALPAFMVPSVPLGGLTTINLGGPARFFAPCTSTDHIRAALGYARQAGLALQVMGGGSNIIFADEGFDGVVLQIAVRGTQFHETADEVQATVAAGEPWDPFVADAVRRGWGGVECLSGIPGLVGATPVQNVGAYGQEVCETITSVIALDRSDLREVTFTSEECIFGYRQSRFKTADADRFIITHVCFRLRPHAGADIRYGELQSALAGRLDRTSLPAGRHILTAVRDTVISLRRRKSMVVDPADENSRSAGSFFTNPIVSAADYERIDRLWRSGGNATAVPSYPARGGVKIPAAWLVENAGFPKNFTRQGVGISAHHALALVNRGGTTRALLSLAGEIQRTVFERFGVRLDREPIVVPFQLQSRNHT